MTIFVAVTVVVVQGVSPVTVPVAALTVTALGALAVQVTDWSIVTVEEKEIARCNSARERVSSGAT